jgi:hypothetical protein
MTQIVYNKNGVAFDIDAIATDLNGKADKDLLNTDTDRGVLVESYVNGTSWYRVYYDGWCEQGGITAATYDPQDYTISLLKPFANANYNITSQLINWDSDSAITFSRWRVWDITASSFKILASNYWPKYWTASGYIAQS